MAFCRFPTDPERRAQWIAAVGRKNWKPTEYTWLCGAHFIGGKKSNDPLSPDYVPSVFKHVSSPVRKGEMKMAAYKRRKESVKKRLGLLTSTTFATQCMPSDELVDSGYKRDAATITDKLTSNATTMTDPKSTCDAATMTDLSSYKLEELEKEHNLLRCECNSLREECTKLKETVKELELDEESFKNDDSKVRYYTGLPCFATLITIFNFVAPYISVTGRTTLPKFKEFLMILMKLRLNLYDQDLAYRFRINQSTVSRKTTKWIETMFVRLQPLIRWPGREELLKTMPLSFKANFKQCVVVIDCFEVFCERPKALKARAQTWSHYKHHNTVKFLIGITPQGAISFISKGWGGRVSDQLITEKCGILDLLHPGDIILADRGFNVQEAVGLYCAEVKIPPFTKGKKQLSQLEVDSARQLSRVRIHVERVIGLMRQKFTILESILPINLIMCNEQADYSLIDKIVTVCCSLCNCCDSVVPFD